MCQHLRTQARSKLKNLRFGHIFAETSTPPREPQIIIGWFRGEGVQGPTLPRQVFKDDGVQVLHDHIIRMSDKILNQFYKEIGFSHPISHSACQMIKQYSNRFDVLYSRESSPWIWECSASQAVKHCA